MGRNNLIINLDSLMVECATPPGTGTRNLETFPSLARPANGAAGSVICGYVSVGVAALNPRLHAAMPSASRKDTQSAALRG